MLLEINRHINSKYIYRDSSSVTKAQVMDGSHAPTVAMQPQGCYFISKSVPSVEDWGHIDSQVIISHEILLHIKHCIVPGL